MGLFDAEYLGMQPTGKIANVRYAEFNCVVDGKITKTGLFPARSSRHDIKRVATHFHHQQVKHFVYLAHASRWSAIRTRLRKKAFATLALMKQNGWWPVYS